MLAHRSSEPPAEQQLNHHAEDKGHVVHFDLDVKSWEKSPPGVDACRPARCPCCGVPAAAAGKVTLHGYGLRPRQRWGPADATPQSQGEIRTLLQRRYRCQSCRAVVVVGAALLATRAANFARRFREPQLGGVRPSAEERPWPRLSQGNRPVDHHIPRAFGAVGSACGAQVLEIAGARVSPDDPHPIEGRKSSPGPHQGANTRNANSTA